MTLTGLHAPCTIDALEAGVHVLLEKPFTVTIQEGGTSPVPSNQIFYNQAIIDAIVKSSRMGREIDIVLPEC